MNPLSLITDIAGRVIDKVIPDKNARDEAKAQIATLALQGELKEAENAVKIILAEAQGNWIQRSWRPMMMLFFAMLVGAHWFGFTAPGLTPEEVDRLLQIVLVGIGGYTIGRSGEKIATTMGKK